jgi:hypothetical protein
VRQLLARRLEDVRGARVQGQRLREEGVGVLVGGDQALAPRCPGERPRLPLGTLERYGAGRPMDFALDGPEQIAAAIAEELGRPVAYRPVDAGGAARAASLIGELL